MAQAQVEIQVKT